MPWPVLTEGDLLLHARRRAGVLTWDSWPFRSLVLQRGTIGRSPVEEHELPGP